AERLERDQPVVQLLASDPERMLWLLVRAGDEAVDRHRDVQLQLAHRSSLCRHARRTAQRVRSHRASQELDEAGDHPVNAIVSVVTLPSDGMFRTSRWRDVEEPLRGVVKETRRGAASGVLNLKAPYRGPYPPETQQAERRADI